MVQEVEDFLKPLVRYVRSDPRITELNSVIPEGTSAPILGPLQKEGIAPSPLWVFRGFDNIGVPFANVEGTGSSSITLAHTGNWGRKNRGNRVMYPIISVFYHCDVPRDSVINAPRSLGARDNCLTLHREMTRLFHIISPPPSNQGFMLWGPNRNGQSSLKVISSVAGEELVIDSVPSGDGMIQGRASFELEILL